MRPDQGPFEGSGISQLAQRIRQLGYNEYDKFQLATVISRMPMRIKIDHWPLTLDAEDLVFAEYLTDRIMTTVTDGIETEVLVKSPLKVGDRVIVSSMNGEQTFLVVDKAVMI
jgi:hypothetical protein